MYIEEKNRANVLIVSLGIALNWMPSSLHSRDGVAKQSTRIIGPIRLKTKLANRALAYTNE